MEGDLKESLETFYAPHNKRLADLLGAQMPWGK
jgi:hypothetical protein